MFKILVLFLLISTSGFTQSFTKQIGVLGSITRMDYFVGVNAFFIKKRLVIGTDVMFGANRTFAQQRIFPRISLIAGWQLLDKKAIEIWPELKVVNSMLNLKVVSNNIHFWQEYLLGFRFSIGNKLRFNLSSHTGWINENFKDQLTHSRMNVGTIGYEGSIGLSYAW